MPDETVIRRKLNGDQLSLRDKMLSEAGSSAYRAVSFRMTDTLVITPFSEREDMFMLMEDEFRELTTVKKSFTELRIAAEDAAEKKYSSAGGAAVEKIYDILAKTAKLSPTSREKLLKRECELAVYFSFPRSFGKLLFSEAKRRRKKTVILADTIYPRSVIVNILSHCGYETCDELVIPTELGLDINEPKDVYDAVLKKSGASPEKLLHIGSDVEADVETPIMNGSKALLMTGVIPLMVRSGRLRGFIQARHVHDYDSPEFLMLHCIFGLYAAYLFDTPVSKQPQSDFCGDKYMLGAVVGGAAAVSGAEPADDIQSALLNAISSDPDAKSGMEDMEKLFRQHFNGHISKFGSRGCGLPLEFLAEYSAAGDRSLLQKQLGPEMFVKWTERSGEPDIAPVYGRKIKQNAVSRLADRLFPPGTRVRNIADGLLVKMKGRSPL